MVVTEKDTPEKIEIIVAQLEDHKHEIEEYIEGVEVTNIEASEDAVAIYTELESVVATHLDVLEEISQETISTSTRTDIVALKDSLEVASTTTIEDKGETSQTPTVTTEDMSGEQNAVSEVSDFSAELEPILIEAKLKSHKDDDEATSTKIKEDTRKRIIEKAEEELEIEIEEEFEKSKEAEESKSI